MGKASIRRQGAFRTIPRDFIQPLDSNEAECRKSGFPGKKKEKLLLRLCNRIIYRCLNSLGCDGRTRNIIHFRRLRFNNCARHFCDRRIGDASSLIVLDYLNSLDLAVNNLYLTDYVAAHAALADAEILILAQLNMAVISGLDVGHCARSVLGIGHDIRHKALGQGFLFGSRILASELTEDDNLGNVAAALIYNVNLYRLEQQP